MTTRYVNSAATGANNGTSWTDAFTTITGVATVDTAGDDIYFAHTHSESTAGALSLAFTNSPTNGPVKLISVTSGENPVATVNPGALVKTTGTNNISFTSGYLYINGLIFEVGDGTGNVSFALTNGKVFIRDVKIRLVATGQYGAIRLGPHCEAYGLTVKFSHAGQVISSNISGGFVYITNLIIEAGSTSPTSLCYGAQSESFVVKDSDLSSLNSSFNLTTNMSKFATFVNCRLPTSWSGDPAASISYTGRVSLYNCSSTSANYDLYIKTYYGTIQQETTLVKTGGATDGTTAISWKMQTNSYAGEYGNALVSDPIAVWNDTTGSSKTITVDILHDSVTALTDAEIWIAIDYLNSSSVPLGENKNDKRATVLTTPANQTSSGATWTTTGMTNPNKQKLEVTFTPQMKGFVYVVVYVAKASYTVYVDPKTVII